MEAQKYHPAVVSRAYGFWGMRNPEGFVEHAGPFGKPVVITTGQAAVTVEVEIAPAPEEGRFRFKHLSKQLVR